MQNVLDVAGEIIECVRDFFDLGKLGECFRGVCFHLVAGAQGIDGKRFDRGFLVAGVFFSAVNDALGRYESAVSVDDMDDLQNIRFFESVALQEPVHEAHDRAGGVFVRDMISVAHISAEDVKTNVIVCQDPRHDKTERGAVR